MKPRVLIVSHDAGGAEVLAAWCREHNNAYTMRYALAGPALRIFQRDFGEFASATLEVMHDFGRDDFVLTGTSLEADLERSAIAMAKEWNIRCISFVDHWDLYRERFGKENEWREQLPDEIWVGDQYAYAHALRENFPSEKIRQVKNPYFSSIIALKKISAASSAVIPSILFVCEPISRKLAATFGPIAASYDDELANMTCFLAEAQHHQTMLSRITLRLHPSEARDKYDAILSPHLSTLPVTISSEPLLAQDILRHDIIVGIESNALVIALLLNKPVYSCITGRHWEISLPHRELQRITNYQQLFNAIQGERP